jgi:hypothetical protein
MRSLRPRLKLVRRFAKTALVKGEKGMITAEERRERIDKALETVVSDFLYHDRKDDPELPLGEIESAIRENDPGVNMIAGRFSELLRLRVPLEEAEGQQSIIREDKPR